MQLRVDSSREITAKSLQKKLDVLQDRLPDYFYSKEELEELYCQETEIRTEMEKLNENN